MNTTATQDTKIRRLKDSIAERLHQQRAEAWEAGYCIHGKYVGGIGIDWICQRCEDGVTIEEMVNDSVDTIVEEVADVIEVAHILTRMEKRFGYETPLIADMRNSLIKMYTMVWEDADKRAVFQILHEKMGG